MQENAKLLMKCKWIVPNHKPQLLPRVKAAAILRHTEHLMYLNNKLQTAANSQGNNRTKHNHVFKIKLLTL